MVIDGGDVRLQLGKGDFLTLEQARGARLTSVVGTAWITVDRDASDVVILAGNSFVIPSDGSVLVAPLMGPVTLDLHGTRRTPADALTRWRRLISKTASLGTMIDAMFYGFGRNRPHGAAEAQ